MPIYEYRCLDCDTHFEELVKSSEDDEVSCYKCSSTSVEKLFSAFGVSAKEGGGPPPPTGPCGSQCGCFPG